MFYLDPFHSESKNRHFPDPTFMLNSQEGYNILSKLFEDEIEFYQWLKLRLLNETSRRKR